MVDGEVKEAGRCRGQPCRGHSVRTVPNDEI